MEKLLVKKLCSSMPASILLSVVILSLCELPDYASDQKISKAVESSIEPQNDGNRIANVFSLARNGSRKEWDERGASAAQNTSDSWKYVTRADLAKLIRDCDQSALASYQKKDLVAASDRLYAGLSCASEFGQSLIAHSGNAAQIETKQSPPLVWLEVFKTLGVPGAKNSAPSFSFSTTKYIPAVNNYAYYLRLQGKYQDSIPIFEKIIAIDPQRIVTNLDLADAFWETGEKEKAQPYYAKYLAAMRKAKFKNVPARVPLRATFK